MSFTISSGLTSNPLRDSLPSKWIDVLHELDVAISDLPPISEVTCKAAINLMQEHGVPLGILDELQVIGRNCADWPVDVDLGNLKSALISASKPENTVLQVLSEVEAIEPDALEFMLYLLFESKQKTDELDSSLRSIAGGVAHQPSHAPLKKPAVQDRTKRQAQEAALQASEKSLKESDADRMNDRPERVFVERERQAKEQREWQQAQKKEVERTLVRESAIRESKLFRKEQKQDVAALDRKLQEEHHREVDIERLMSDRPTLDKPVVQRPDRFRRDLKRMEEIKSDVQDAEALIDRVVTTEEELADLSDHDFSNIERDVTIARRAQHTAYRDEKDLDLVLRAEKDLASGETDVERDLKVAMKSEYQLGLRDELDDVRTALDDAKRVEAFAEESAHALESIEKRIARTVNELHREIDLMKKVSAAEKHIAITEEDALHTFEVFAGWVHSHPLYEHLYEHRYDHRHPYEVR